MLDTSVTREVNAHGRHDKDASASARPGNVPSSASGPFGSRAGRPCGPVSRWVVGLVGLAALGTGITMFLTPPLMIAIWPWSLTPLTCRVVGAIFCLGAASIGTLADPRWIAIRLMLQVEAFMIALMLIAVLRAPGEFATDRPLTWLMLTGFAGVLMGSAYLWYSHEVTPRTTQAARSGGTKAPGTRQT